MVPAVLIRKLQVVHQMSERVPYLVSTWLFIFKAQKENHSLFFG